MDAIRKKMQSLKAETDGLYATIGRFEDSTKEYNRMADQADCDIRDYGKKVQQLEIGFDETNDKLLKATESLEEKEKHFKEVEADVAALSRRIMLMEEEAKKSEQNLADTVTKLALSSKEADQVITYKFLISFTLFFVCSKIYCRKNKIKTSLSSLYWI